MESVYNMFDLTQQERQVVLFLVAIALVGMIVRVVVTSVEPARAIFNAQQNIGKINLNSADIDLLMSVPGIGARLAQRIIAYRNERGKFDSLDELTKIKGITRYRFERTKDYFFIR